MTASQLEMRGHGDAGRIGCRYAQVYDVPGYNGALSLPTALPGSYVPSGAGQPQVLAQSGSGDDS